MPVRFHIQKTPNISLTGMFIMKNLEIIFQMIFLLFCKPQVNKSMKIELQEL